MPVNNMITDEVNDMHDCYGVVSLDSVAGISIMLKHSSRSDRCECGHYLREHANAFLEIYGENVKSGFPNIGPCKHDSRDVHIRVGAWGFSLKFGIGKKVCPCSGYVMTQKVRNRITKELKREVPRT